MDVVMRGRETALGIVRELPKRSHAVCLAETLLAPLGNRWLAGGLAGGIPRSGPGWQRESTEDSLYLPTA